MSIKKAVIQVLVACCLLMIVGGSFAAKNDEMKGHKDAGHHVKSHGVKEEKHKHKHQHNSPQGLFSGSERSSVYNYYRHQNSEHAGGKHPNKKEKHKKLSHGLQKKLQRGGELPPGWQTKVNRGEVLDAELLRYARPLPDDLSRRLPALRSGEEMLRIGDKVVRVLEGNGTVLDVIDLADAVLR